MPDLGFYHPIVIHFAIGLITAGVFLRWLSLTRRGAFAGPAAVTLILLATAATLVAAQSGEDTKRRPSRRGARVPDARTSRALNRPDDGFRLLRVRPARVPLHPPDRQA